MFERVTFTILLTMRPARQPVPNWTQLVPEHIRCTLQEALADPAYQALPTFRAQCVHLTALPGITPYYAGKLLGVDPKGVRRQVEKAYGPRRPPGRPPVLNDEQVTAVTAFIRQRWELHDPASVCDVLNFIWEQFEISVIPDTLRRWLNTRSDFRIARSRPMEDHRLQVSAGDIDAYFGLLTQAIEGVPSGLIFNLDESGFQRFVDLKHSSIVVPRDASHALHSVSRQEKRATFLLTVAADGTCLKPLLVVPRVTIEAELFLAGYGPQNCIITHSARGYITRDLFEHYVRFVLIPAVHERRRALGYDGPAVLTMDRCSCHCGATLQSLCEQNGIRLVYLPPHSSDQTQVCDLGLFGNLKAAQSRIHVPDGMSLQSRQVIRIISAFQATCHPLAVTSAFRRAGISNVWRYGNLYAVVTPGTCSGVREPLEAWSQRTLPNRFDKARISIGEGTWALGAPMPGSWARPLVVREDTSEPRACQDELAVILVESDDESDSGDHTEDPQF